jgi:hypothetical protein
MKRTKKQHYISQSIMKTFFENSKVKEYNLKTYNNYNSSIENSMCCSDIYESDYYDDNKLENAFSALYDGKFAFILTNIKDYLNRGLVNDANLLIKKNFYYYTVSYYKSLASLIRLSKLETEELERNNSTKKMFDLITNVKYMNRLSLILEKCYKIYIIKSCSSNYILCDQFIATASSLFNCMFLNISNRDIGVKGSIIFLPISKDYYALLLDKDMTIDFSIDKINELSEDQTQKINNIIYNNATEKIIGVRNFQYNFENTNSFGDERCYVGYANSSSRAWKKKKEIFYFEQQQHIYDTFQKFEWVDYRKLGRNDLCHCGSGKKYKKCCMEIDKRCNTIMQNIKNKTINDNCLIDNRLGLEEIIKL